MIPQLWIGIDLIGFSFETDREGHRVRVSFPSTPDAFSSLPESIADQWLPSLVPAGPVFDEPDRDNRTVGLVIFEVTVEVSTDVPFPKPEEVTPELRAIADRDLGVGRDIATQVAVLLLRHLRAAAPHQSWLGLATHAPEQYGIAALEFRATGDHILGYGPMQSVTMRSSRIRLDVEDMHHIAAATSEDIEPGVAESLLADVSHLSDASGANDRDRAWIVAAIACEVRVKRELRARAASDQRELVELLLRRRSNLPDLLGEVWKAVVGTSLRAVNPDLFDKVNSLNMQRNRLVHAGQRDPRVPQHLDPAHIAQALFEWLDEGAP